MSAIRETAERPLPPSDTQLIEVRQAAERRYSLAAGFASGSRFLDIGAGDQRLWDYLKLYAELYVAVDPELTEMEDSLPGYTISHRMPVMEYFENHSIPSYGGFDTVFALEVIEHLDPGQQEAFLEAAWARTGSRLIISTPSPDCLRWYPMSEAFVGVGNPFHTRELHEWQLRAMIARQCKGVFQILTFRAGMIGNGEPIWDTGDKRPAGFYLMVIERSEGNGV